MKLTVESSMKIEDGKHQGTIKEVTYRVKPYDYTDIRIETTDGVRITYGVPTKLTFESKLGRLLVEFGAELEVDKVIDPEEVLVNKRCEFMTITETTERGTFPKVVPGSLKCLN